MCVDLDPVEAVIPDHASPESIVQIHDDALRHAPQAGYDNFNDVVGDIGKTFEGAKILCAIPETFFEPIPAAQPGRDTLHIIDEDTSTLPRILGNTRIQSSDGRVKRFCHLMVEVAEKAFVRERKVALEDSRRKVRLNGLPNT